MLRHFHFRRPVLSDDIVIDRLRQRLPRLVDATPGTPLDVAGLDSLDLVEVLCVVDEEFGVRLHEEDLERARTVGDLARRVATRAPAGWGGHPGERRTP